MKLRFQQVIVLFFALAGTALCFAGGGMQPERAEHGMVASVTSWLRKPAWRS